MISSGTATSTGATIHWAAARVPAAAPIAVVALAALRTRASASASPASP